MVSHSHNPNPWDIEVVEGLGVEGQPWLHAEIKAIWDRFCLKYLNEQNNNTT